MELAQSLIILIIIVMIIMIVQLAMIIKAIGLIASDANTIRRRLRLRRPAIGQ
jgi:hypothetical protein